MIIEIIIMTIKLRFEFGIVSNGNGNNALESEENDSNEEKDDNWGEGSDDTDGE